MSPIKGGAASLGGGISNAGVLSVTRSEVCQNAAFNQGGGIYTAGPLSLSRVQVYDNSLASPGAEGGGLFVQTGGSAIVTNSSFTNNRMSRGGGISVAFGGTLFIRRSTLTQNFADSTLPSPLPGQGGAIYNAGLAFVDETDIGEGNAVINSDGQGGGIYNAGILVMTRSVLRGNVIDRETPSALGPALGAGLHNAGVASIASSTVSGNLIQPRILGMGAGISNTGTLSLSNVTITDNANGGAGIGNGAGLYPAGGTVTVRNSIIASQAVGDDCTFGVTTDGYNIDSDDTCGLLSAAAMGTDQPNVADPGLLPLADYGGPTRSHNLADDSPAIDGGNPAGCLTDPNGIGPANIPLVADQRGNFFGEVGGVGGEPSGCDVGAVEFNLISNGMMEDDKDRDDVPDGWTGVNLVGPDDLYCLPRAVFPGHCAFGLFGDPSQVKQLVQSFDRAGDERRPLFPGGPHQRLLRHRHASGAGAVRRSTDRRDRGGVRHAAGHGHLRLRGPQRGYRDHRELHLRPHHGDHRGGHRRGPVHRPREPCARRCRR